jgi:hypothetical protein
MAQAKFQLDRARYYVITWRCRRECDTLCANRTSLSGKHCAAIAAVHHHCRDSVAPLGWVQAAAEAQGAARVCDGPSAPGQADDKLSAMFKACALRSHKYREAGLMLQGSKNDSILMQQDPKEHKRLRKEFGVFFTADNVAKVVDRLTGAASHAPAFSMTNARWQKLQPRSETCETVDGPGSHEA